MFAFNHIGLTHLFREIFIPQQRSRSKSAREYSYLAKRQVLEEQSVLPGMEEPELPLPFPTMQIVKKKWARN